MMKKIILAIAIAATSLGASAHWSNRIHYHMDDGSVKYSQTIEPSVETTFDTGRNGRRVRIETTTTCEQTRLNRRNNHLRCLLEGKIVKRTFEPDQASVTIAPIVERAIERDTYGRRVIVTTTYTCTDVRWNRREAVCLDWDTTVTREYVRRNNQNDYDLNGDGRTDPWERLLFQSFKNVLED